jgi:hypothetical protein
MVRQSLLNRMIKEWGYPKGLIAVEKSVGLYPPRGDLAFRGRAPSKGRRGQARGLISTTAIPSLKTSNHRRRFDIVCYVQADETLAPLLVVECKAKSELGLAKAQVLSYNAFLGAPFLCLASEDEIHTFWRSKADGLASIPFLPPYAELVAASRQV